MKVDVLLGLQWGDEGKGKVVDVLTPNYDIVARFQGGPNAGHTLEFNGIKHVLHTIPSGIFHKHVTNIIGNGVVIDPVIFKKEVEALENMGVDVKSNLLISRKAHLILPTHKLLDAADEETKGNSKIGSTLKGIGPTYSDKTSRNGLRVGDIEQADFKEKYNTLVKKHIKLLEFYNFNYSLKESEEHWFAGIELLKEFKQIDSEYFINQALDENKSILAEGAQGALLDIDFGTYPFVTSSNTVCAGACTGLGIAPTRIGRVFGIFKAYCTRVGSGPFPTELFDETGESLRKIGNEFGSTTGRPRRCGWLDMPALKYSVMINGVTDLIMMKTDVLSGFPEIKVCTKYSSNNELTEKFPYSITNKLTPVYSSYKGWDKELQQTKSISELPVELTDYIENIEKSTKVPIAIVSVGPDRTQTLIRKNFN